MVSERGEGSNAQMMKYRRKVGEFCSKSFSSENIVSTLNSISLG